MPRRKTTDPQAVATDPLDMVLEQLGLQGNLHHSVADDPQIGSRRRHAAQLLYAALAYARAHDAKLAAPYTPALTLLETLASVDQEPNHWNTQLALLDVVAAHIEAANGSELPLQRSISAMRQRLSTHIDTPLPERWRRWAQEASHE
jgi:hypothetical protein